MCETLLIFFTMKCINASPGIKLFYYKPADMGKLFFIDKQTQNLYLGTYVHARLKNSK